MICVIIQKGLVYAAERGAEKTSHITRIKDVTYHADNTK